MPPRCIERISVISSTISAVCGNSSESSMPQRPCCLNFQGLAITVAVAPPALSYLMSDEPGKAEPSYFASAGLGSNRSRWLGPPPMNSEIIARARGSAGGVFGFKLNALRSRSGLIGLAAACSSFISQASANPPMPIALEPRKCRREAHRPGSGRRGEFPFPDGAVIDLSNSRAPSIHVQETVRLEQRQAKAGQGLLLGRGGGLGCR